MGTTVGKMADDDVDNTFHAARFGISPPIFGVTVTRSINLSATVNSIIHKII